MQFAACGVSDRSESKTRAESERALFDDSATARDLDGKRIAATVADCAGSRCSIEMVRLASLTDSADPGMFQEMGRFTRDSRGRFVTTDLRGEAVLLFGAGGEFLKRAGRAGSGPGEYRMAMTALFGPGDSVSVYDFSLRRLTTLDPELNHVREQPMAHAPAMIMPNGTFIIASLIRTPELFGYPLHLANATGEIVRSFGTDTPELTPRNSRDSRNSRRVAGPASANEIWTAAPGRYVLERWRVRADSIQMQQRVTIRSSWFRESDKLTGSRAVIPNPYIESVWEDERGFVWVLLLDADANWRPPPNANSSGEVPVTMDDNDRAYDAVLEVIDPDAQVVIATRRFPSIQWSRPPGRLVMSRSTRDSSAPAFDVWKPTVVIKESVR